MAGLLGVHIKSDTKALGLNTGSSNEKVTLAKPSHRVAPLELMNICGD